MSKPYVKPTVKTLKADEIVEAMGPVSCGSGAPRQTNPVDDSVDPQGGTSGGFQKLS